MSGNTTDYVIEIFHKAIKGEVFECCLKANTRLPMIYIDDAIRGIVELMDTPTSKITIRSSYNVSGLSFSPTELYEEIKKHIPDFKIIYKPDFDKRLPILILKVSMIQLLKMIGDGPLSMIWLKQ